MEIEIRFINPHNHDLGYQVKVTSWGQPVFFSAHDPVTGEPIITLEHALKVAGYYTWPSE